ncbi:MAG: hypothetical protein AAFU60_10510 [Bacteroidota bacterium]
MMQRIYSEDIGTHAHFTHVVAEPLTEYGTLQIAGLALPFTSPHAEAEAMLYLRRIFLRLLATKRLTLFFREAKPAPVQRIRTHKKLLYSFIKKHPDKPFTVEQEFFTGEESLLCSALPLTTELLADALPLCFSSLCSHLLVTEQALPERELTRMLTTWHDALVAHNYSQQFSLPLTLFLQEGSLLMRTIVDGHDQLFAEWFGKPADLEGIYWQG